ncbi:MAG: MBL fold metallo-hydrolase [Thermodesulfobacteriota bacterium]|nr:MBL fold metallo-hydrolase [Thermodesulfobacteriota bacterium]
MITTDRDNLRKVYPVLNTGFARAYLIEGNEGLMAVDVGSPGCAKDIAEYITRVLGRTLDDLKYITATHFHIDHIGGIGHLLDVCSPRTRVLFHYMVKDYITGRKKISLIRNWFVGLPPATVVSARYLRRFSHLGVESLTGIPIPGLRNIMKLPFSHDRIDYFGSEGRKIYPLGDLGFGEWEAIRTPGHTEDSVCFFNRTTRELISGDLIINISKDGRGELNRFHWSRNVIKESFDYLRGTIKPVLIYPGHGEVMAENVDILAKVKAF